jgi:acyl-coenzyme A thioesterase PaaI-like protein
MDSKAKLFVSALPQASHLGMELVNEAWDGVGMRLKYQPSVTALDANLYHPGSLMTLMDTACGTAAAHVLPGSEACPTLDLRWFCVRKYS